MTNYRSTKNIKWIMETIKKNKREQNELKTNLCKE